MSENLPALEDLLADHDMLLAALETPALWSREVADALPDSPITSVSVRPVGTGQVASCLRVVLDHGDAATPNTAGSTTSFVVKTGSHDPVSRSVSAALRHGEIEVGFYTRMAPHCSTRTPVCHLSAINANADDFVLVLEDLAAHQQADQIRGMSLEHTEQALDQLAALHAQWWGTVPSGTSSFLTERGDPTAHAALLGMLHEGFAQRYAGMLDADVLAVGERLIAAAPDYLVNRPGPTAVVHGDFRPDNLLVPAGGLDDSVAVLDWQTVTVGPALADVSYFLGGALLPEQRREHEQELLESYRSALAARGVELSAAEVSEGYRRYALDGLVMAIGASQVVGQTDRGDDMFCAMAQRSAHHALESGTFELLGT
ncbi:MAG: phosphotransferase [Microthrixaceae bacterium]|nr:phosphotransferase [Microthrixaceae bacterium]MCO5321045.1 phosphotransferase [Microthrixaceae bacterium]